MNQLGLELTDKEVQHMVWLADTDGDGKINYEEFVTVMTSRHDMDFPPTASRRS